MDPSIKADVSCMNCCRRFLSGEHCVTGEYVNTSTVPAIIGFTPAIPARVIPLDLKNGPVQCKSGAWFISLGNADVTCEPDCNPFTCCCAGQGCIQTCINGTDDWQSRIDRFNVTKTAEQLARKRLFGAISC